MLNVSINKLRIKQSDLPQRTQDVKRVTRFSLFCPDTGVEIQVFDYSSKKCQKF